MNEANVVQMYAEEAPVSPVTVELLMREAEDAKEEARLLRVALERIRQEAQDAITRLPDGVKVSRNLAMGALITIAGLAEAE